MKVWNGYGSEHSMNLVMIGHFKEVPNAKEAKALIEQLTEQVLGETDIQRSEPSPQERRFSDAMLKLLDSANLYTVGPAELEQFIYDVRVKIEDNKVVVLTDEVDVSAFLKVLIEKGARVEVYSAHHYPDTEYGRGN